MCSPSSFGLPNFPTELCPGVLLLGLSAHFRENSGTITGARVQRSSVVLALQSSTQTLFASCSPSIKSGTARHGGE